MEYILIAVLAVCAIFIVIAVLLQKSGKEGLSGTLVGGTETYYGKDDSVKKDKKLAKWTAVVAVVFAIAVSIVYIIQPDYAGQQTDHRGWTEFAGEYGDVIEHDYDFTQQD